MFREGNYSSKMLSDICESSAVTPAEHVPSHLGPASSATVLIDPSRPPKDGALAQLMHRQLEGSLRMLTGFICCLEEAKRLRRTAARFPGKSGGKLHFRGGCVGSERC